MAPNTRAQMIQTAVRMFQRDGYHATSWRALVDEAGTPWGSIHHHFPGGKEDLAVAAIAVGSDAVAAIIEGCFAEAANAPTAVGRWFTGTAKALAASDYTAGCPIATVALETAAESAPIQAAARHAFDRWESVLAAGLRQGGAGRAAARVAAQTILALFEGVLLLARVRASTEPVAIGARQAEAIALAAIETEPRLGRGRARRS